MNRRKRTEILVKSSDEILKQLSAVITGKYHVTVLEQPEDGLVMVKIRETAQKTLFYLGEVLVTECKVQINGSPGIGIIKGHQPEKAYQLAVVDAACNAGLDETAGWGKLLLQQQEQIVKEKQRLDRQILRTKVDFHTMKLT